MKNPCTGVTRFGNGADFGTYTIYSDACGTASAADEWTAASSYNRADDLPLVPDRGA